MSRQERKHHGNVMRGKAPEDIFLRPDLADVQPVGVEVLDLPQFSASNQFLQLTIAG